MIVRVVDDDAPVRVALVRLLKSAGHSAVAFETAMSFLSENDFSAPGCIILDVGLPDLDGLALQEMLAQRGSTTPVIFLTGHADSKTRARAMEGGAVDFLAKPVDEEALLDAVARALASQAVRRLAGSQS